MSPLALCFALLLSTPLSGRFAAGEDPLEALRFFPPDLVGYFRTPFPEGSRLRSGLGAEMRARDAAKEVSGAVEILAGWELELSPEEIARWKERFLGHIGFLHSPVETGPDGAGNDLDWMAVLEGLPEREAASSPDALEPRTFLGVASYARFGGRVLAASRPALVEAMLRRGRRAEGDGPTFRDRPDVGRMIVSLPRDEEVAFWDFPAMHRGRTAPADTVAALLGQLAEILGPMVLTVSPEPDEAGAFRTEVNFDLKSRPETFRIYETIRQGARPLTLGSYVPPEAVLTLLASLDARALLAALRSAGVGKEAGGETPLARLGFQTLFDPRGPILEWAAEAAVREVALFANLRLGDRAIVGLLFRIEPPPWGMALKAGDPVSLDALRDRLEAAEALVEKEDGILDTILADGRPLAIGSDGDVLLVSNDVETLKSMIDARREGKSVTARAGFLRLFPEARARSKALFLDGTPLKDLLLPVLRFVSVSVPRNEFLVGVETFEDPDRLRVRLGTVPDLAELVPEGGSGDPVVLGAVFGRTPMRRSEEQALGVLLALREGERLFRAEELRDVDLDEIGEFGTLADLGRAGSRFLPVSLRMAPGRIEGEAFGYLFRVDVPPDPGHAAATFVATAWPKEYGATGVSSFLLREEGPPFRRVSKGYSGAGRGPRPRDALTPPSTWSDSQEMLAWSPLF